MRANRSIVLIVSSALVLLLPTWDGLEAAAISCQPANVDGWPCCSNCNYCIDNSAFIAGTFDAVNDSYNGMRTGFQVCGESSGSRTVTFSVNGKTASVFLFSHECVDKHLDELDWWSSEPIFSSSTSVDFWVSDGEPVSIVTSKTTDNINYNLRKVTDYSPYGEWLESSGGSVSCGSGERCADYVTSSGTEKTCCIPAHLIGSADMTICPGGVRQGQPPPAMQ